MSNILYAIGGGAAIALIFGLFVSGKFGKGKDLLHKLFQKKEQEKIDAVEDHQKTVVVNIKEKEKLAEESKKKIADIQKEAATEIESVLKEDNIARIKKEIDEEWENL